MPTLTEPCPRLRDVTADVGLWCFGCGRRVWKKGTAPDRWIETLCGDPKCPLPMGVK